MSKIKDDPQKMWKKRIIDMKLNYHARPIQKIELNINVALFSYTRAFGDGPRILNHGQVTWTTPELAPPLLTTTPHQREDVSALDRFNVHR
ncbi:hypothetical protein TNCV_4398681 [Trichonephila clavipes]|nr:hypothetical protein TNCV_4398681 [Trichonephila clavipes]